MYCSVPGAHKGIGMKNFRKTEVPWPFSTGECCGTCLGLYDEDVFTYCTKYGHALTCDMVCDSWWGLDRKRRIGRYELRAKKRY